MIPKPSPSPADEMRAELNRRSECRRVGVDDEALGIDMNLHSYAEALLSDHSRLVEEIGRLKTALNTPELHDFAKGVVAEAQHQRERWGVDGDAGKTAADWFWLVGYLAGKTLTAANSGNTEKALHHTISTAAALANWHATISGRDCRMRPGIDARAALSPSQKEG